MRVTVLVKLRTRPKESKLLSGWQIIIGLDSTNARIERLFE